MTVYPDELITRVCEEIAYEKGTVTLTQLWEVAGELLGVKDLINDLPMRRFVIYSLCSNPDIILMDSNGNVSKPQSDDDIDKLDDSFQVSISEEKLWWVLTGGYSKKDSSIGNAAFQLLMEIAHSKTKGINTIELAQLTKQDSRSVTGRIKKISHLVNSIQVVHKGHVVRNLKLRKFVSSKDSMEGENPEQYVRMKDHLAEIVEIVKNSKNGVRQIADLRRQLKFDKNRRLARAFTTAIAWLDEKNYLKKVMVVSPTNSSITIRCVKYVKDYIPANEGGDINDYSDSDEQDMSNDEGDDDDDDEEPSESLDTSNAAKMLQGQEVILVQDQSNHNLANNGVKLNRFHPIQNQTFDMVEATGEKGMPTMDIVNIMTGKDYKRAFAKISDYFLVAKNSKSKSSGLKKDYNYQLTRLYDFEGKKKFFRLFTKDNFEALTQSQNKGFSKESIERLANGGWKYPIKVQCNNIDSLTKENFQPLNATLRFTTTANGEQRFFWNGELDVPASENAPKLGRKRKLTALQDTTILEDIPNKKATSEEKPIQRNNENHYDESKMVLQIDGFSANSLRSLQRQKAIIEVLKKSNGISALKEQFFEDVAKYMASTTSLDKKTVRGDVELMLSTNKLNYKIDDITQKKLIYLPETSEDIINEYVIREKDNKRAAFKDVLHDTEIYFYDQKAHDRFTRKSRTAQRMRKYQSGSKKSSEPTNSTSVELFEARKTKRKATKEKEKNVPKAKQKLTQHKSAIESRSFNISTKDGMEKLIKSVVITKSIKNEIIWDRITTLFPSNSLDNLKRKWTLRRIQMGQQGWKARVSKWRKALLQGIKEEKITLNQTEILDLSALLNLWESYEKESVLDRVKLSKSYEQNIKKLTYLPSKNLQTTGTSSLAMSSMIQREIASLKQMHTIGISQNIGEIEKEERQDRVKSIVRSILIEVQDVSKNEIDVLKDIPKDELDNIIMDMAKHKQLFLHGSKLKSTDILYEFLQTKGNYQMFVKAAYFNNNLSHMLESANGVVISEEFEDYQSWVIIDRLANEELLVDVIPMIRHIRPLTYTTRSFEIRTLTPPLLLSAKSHQDNKTKKIKAIPAPLGKAYSKIWIDSQGALRSDIWKSIVVAILNEILYNPGINPAQLSRNCDMLLGKEEAFAICQWLESRELIHSTQYHGFAVNGQWHELFQS